jgi:hypothetical protein
LASAALVAVPGRHQAAAPEPAWPSEPPQLYQSAQLNLPRTGVGLGGTAWLEYEGWCVGDITWPGGTGSVQSCRFLPPAGQLDLVVVEPGKYAPDGYSLVVAVVSGESRPGESVHGWLTDASGTGDLTTDRPPGQPGVVFLWGFTRGGSFGLRISADDGRLIASCQDCGAQER